MRFLLTSGGITNASIHDSLVDLLGKPLAECNALCIPTAIYAFPGGAAFAYRLITGSAASPLCGLGWKSLGVLEITALPSIDQKHWLPVVRATDALLVEGVEPLYLSYSISEPDWQTSCPRCRARLRGGERRESRDGPKVGEQFVYGDPLTVAIERWEWSISRCFRTWITRRCLTIPWPARKNGRPNIRAGYAIDDQTAIRVVDGTVELVSEGIGSCSAPAQQLANRVRSNAARLGERTLARTSRRYRQLCRRGANSPVPARRATLLPRARLAAARGASSTPWRGCIGPVDELLRGWRENPRLGRRSRRLPSPAWPRASSSVPSATRIIP